MSIILAPATQNFPPPTLPPFLPLGHLTLLLGDPGVGKSLLAVDLATRLSNNAAPPPHPRTPRDIPSDQCPEDADPHDFQPATAILLSTEDSDDTLKARLITAGANFSHIALPDPALSLLPPLPRDFRPTFSPAQPQPASLIEYLLLHLKKLPNPRLLILDSLPSFLGTHDCSNAASIRSLLHPLLRIAEYHGLAILGLNHLTKSHRTSQSPLLRSLGSLAYPALARSILLLTHDPAHPNRRLLTQIKNNLAPLHPPLTFTFTLAPQESPGIAIPVAPAPHLIWHPSPLPPIPYPLPPAPPLSPDPFTQSQLDLAQQFLTESLANGPLPTSLLLKQARTLGLSQRTLSRARFLLHTHCFLHGPTNQWHITLPPNPPLP